MKKKYMKPELGDSLMSGNAVIASSWTVDGEKDPDNGDGGDIIEGNPEGGAGSRRNGSAWDFNW